MNGAGGAVLCLCVGGQCGVVCVTEVVVVAAVVYLCACVRACVF